MPSSWSRWQETTCIDLPPIASNTVIRRLWQETEAVIQKIQWAIFTTLMLVVTTASAAPKAKPKASPAPAVTPAATAVAKPAPVPTATSSPTPVPTPAKLSLQKNAPKSALPFWQTKPDLQKKMAEQRSIIVAVQQEDLPNGKVALRMSGAGHIQRPKETCYLLAQDFPKLKEVSDHFRTVNWDPLSQRLFVITEAMGYQSRMLMKITPVSEDWRSELQFEVIWGHFTGMKGLIGFQKIGPRTTEVSFTANYEADELPIPKILMGFALEVVTQKVAEKMRTYIETHSK